MQAELYLDKSNCGKFTDPVIEGGSIPLPSKGVYGSGLELNILLDHSLIEIFALGGRARISSRIYPEDILKPRWGWELVGTISSFEAVRASAICWEMHDS